MGKEKLNLSIEGDLKKAIKHIAISEGTTVSSLIEIYINALNCNKDIIRALKDMEKKKKK